MTQTGYFLVGLVAGFGIAGAALGYDMIYWHDLALKRGTQYDHVVFTKPVTIIASDNKSALVTYSEFREMVTVYGPWGSSHDKFYGNYIGVCAPAKPEYSCATNIPTPSAITHGANSPAVTGSGNTVVVDEKAREK